MKAVFTDMPHKPTTPLTIAEALQYEAENPPRYEEYHPRSMMPREGEKCHQGCCIYHNKSWVKKFSIKDALRWEAERAKETR